MTVVIRQPSEAELSALHAMWWKLRSLNSTDQPELVWQPVLQTYVIAVPYDPRTFNRIPRYMAGNYPPPYYQSWNYLDRWRNPPLRGFQPYALAIPVVIYEKLPAAIRQPNATIITGQPRPSLTRGKGLNFPALSFNGAPVIDGVAYANNMNTYCGNIAGNPELQNPVVLNAPIQPGCSCTIPNL